MYVSFETTTQGQDQLHVFRVETQGRDQYIALY